MEPIGAWSPGKVAQWLRGLDKALQQYPFEAWSLTGNDLLQLSYRRLEELGLRRVGHQELLLEAVEQLCVLVSERPWGWSEALSRSPAPSAVMTTYDGEAIETPSPDLLACIAELITAAKGLFSWLNRYLFSHLHDYSASRDIVLLCGELAQILQKDCRVSERENRILLICRHLAGICENISRCSPAALLNQTAILESVDLGIEIKSTNSCLHFIAGTATEVRDLCGEMVGWTRVNLVKKILEKPNQVTLVLKKIPLTSVGSPCSPRSPCIQVSRTRYHHAHSMRTEPSPIGLLTRHGWGRIHPRLELPAPCLTPPTLSSSLAGVATRLSRRRVSCRELGKVDCDGWLLKKKDHVGFMSQKWKRCWFVLKGHVLYWYNQPSDEKAVGLINVSTYDLESTREQKKKYVFQLCHEKYKPFIFAAETLADLNCYSETEAEDPDDDSPRPGSELVSVNSPGEELESLIKCLQQGGVSLIGKRQLLTHEQYRKSFVKRNKNPQINERVHLVRALQSTLKAKVAELQILDQVLNDSELTSEKFRHWKEEHQELYQEIHQWWGHRPGRAEGLEAELGAESSPQEAAGATP
uniref:Connector enhancer of kinase suppressor of Ras 1 n=1 Tax=Chelydra serpentina TaxID=8475 RepID=A0A8C3XNC6_CHESE